MVVSQPTSFVEWPAENKRKDCEIQLSNPTQQANTAGEVRDFHRVPLWLGRSLKIFARK
jgi:hypothetical protein